MITITHQIIITMIIITLTTIIHQFLIISLAISEEVISTDFNYSLRYKDKSHTICMAFCFKLTNRF